jgi:folate-binding protein YgfZ
VITGYEIPRDVVQVGGPEAASYLQGQLSQDVDALPAGSARASFVLQPTGKVESWVRVTRLDGDTFLLDVDAGHGEALLTRLRRFLLRTKAEVESRDDLVCVAFRGPGADALDDSAWQGVLLRQPVTTPAGVGLDVIGSNVPYPDGVVAGTAEEYEASRIAAGVPAMGAELTEATIPAEVGQRIIDESVSFTKGCFTGQELVARIDSRGGNVPRHLRALKVDGDVAPPPGASILLEEAGVGEVTSSAISAQLGGAVALGFVRRAVEPPVHATVVWPDGEASVEIRRLPTATDQ